MIGLGYSYWKQVITILRDVIPVYDKVNRVISLGKDDLYRNEGIRENVKPGDFILDAGSGFGNMSLASLKITSNNKYKNSKLKILSAKIYTTRTQSDIQDIWNVNYKYNKSGVLMYVIKKSNDEEIGYEKKLFLSFQNLYSIFSCNNRFMGQLIKKGSFHYPCNIV